jgi:hypothetical protein
MRVTAERKKRALELLRHGNISRLSPEAQVAYTLSLLVSDDDGRINKVTLELANSDPAMRSIAGELLRKVHS